MTNQYGAFLPRYSPLSTTVTVIMGWVSYYRWFLPVYGHTGPMHVAHTCVYHYTLGLKLGLELFHKKSVQYWKSCSN